MITIYRVKSRPDEYQCVWYQPQDQPLFDLFTTGERIGEQWRLPQLIVGDDSQRACEVPDFPALRYNLLLSSERAWEIIRPLVEDSVEALPVIHPNGNRCYAINVTRVLDCLLTEQCRTNRLLNDQSGYFSSIYTYAFDEQVVQNEHLFRCPQMKAFEIYASPKFKELVEGNNLSGLKFTKIYP